MFVQVLLNAFSVMALGRRGIVRPVAALMAVVMRYSVGLVPMIQLAPTES